VLTAYQTMATKQEGPIPSSAPCTTAKWSSPFISCAGTCHAAVVALTAGRFLADAAYACFRFCRGVRMVEAQSARDHLLPFWADATGRAPPPRLITTSRPARPRSWRA
jgi:hypothetical protein